MSNTLFTIKIRLVREVVVKSEALTVSEYIEALTGERKFAVEKLRDVIKKNLPEGFREEMNYGMIGYVVPLSLYPEGYLGNKGMSLPFMSIASQKQNIAVYHMGLYANPELMRWFKSTYETAFGCKLDMGKSCLRFRRMETIPYDLIGELASKISVLEWIGMYEKSRSKKN